MYICVDFDGTCVSHNFPAIGKEIGAAPVLKYLASKGHKLILYTMRDNHVEGNKTYCFLDDAIKWFRDHDIPLFSSNSNPNATFSSSPKVHADLYIDDRSLGIPLVSETRGSYVDWEKCLVLLSKMNLIDAEDFVDLTKQVISERL